MWNYSIFSLVENTYWSIIGSLCYPLVIGLPGSQFNMLVGQTHLSESCLRSYFHHGTSQSMYTSSEFYAARITVERETIVANMEAKMFNFTTRESVSTQQPSRRYIQNLMQAFTINDSEEKVQYRKTVIA